jgi:ABC-type transport system substrate-binding protein
MDSVGSTHSLLLAWVWEMQKRYAVLSCLCMLVILGFPVNEVPHADAGVPVTNGFTDEQMVPSEESIIDLEYDNSFFGVNDAGLSGEWMTETMESRSRYLFRGTGSFDIDITSNIPIDLSRHYTPEDVIVNDMNYQWNGHDTIEFMMEPAMYIDPGIYVARSTNESIINPGWSVVDIGASVTFLQEPVIDGTEQTLESFWIGLYKPIDEGLMFNFLTEQTFWSPITVGNTVEFHSTALVYSPYEYPVCWMPTLDINLFVAETHYSLDTFQGDSPLGFQVSGPVGDILDVSVSSPSGELFYAYPNKAHGDIWLWWGGRTGNPVQSLEFYEGGVEEIYNENADLSSEVLLFSDFNLQEYTGYDTIRKGYGYLSINCHKYPLNITAFRRALAFAIDKEWISEAMFGGKSSPHDSLWPDVGPFSAETLLGYHYYFADMPKANELLDAAGFLDTDMDGYREAPDGSDFSLNVESTYYEASDINFLVCQHITTTLQILGIRATHVPTDFMDYLGRMQNHQDYDMALLGVDLRSADIRWLADNFRSEGALECNLNYPNFRNSSFDAWSDQLYAATSFENVQAAAIEMQKILAYECPYIVCYDNSMFGAARNDLSGVHMNPTTGVANLDTYYSLVVPDWRQVSTAIPMPNSLNPFTISEWHGTSFNPLTLIYESLVREDNQENLEPWLSETWTTLQDGSESAIDVQLKDDVLWQDGVSFTSSDVKFTFSYMQTHGLGLFGDVLSKIQSISILSSYHLQIQLSSATYWDITELLAIPILPEHIWKFVTDPYSFTNDNPIGTGPFALASYNPLINFGAPIANIVGEQLMTLNHPESGSVWLDEEGEYLIGVDYYSGELPLEYEITLTFDDTETTIHGTISEDDIIDTDSVPASADEEEGLRHIWLPADVELSISVDWNTTADLDVMMWTPSNIYTESIDSMVLNRWHFYEYQLAPPEYLEFRYNLMQDDVNSLIRDGSVDLGLGYGVGIDDINPYIYDVNEALRNGYGFFVFNTAKYPFNETALRRAFAFALDKNRISDELWGGAAQPLDSVVPAVNGFSLEGEVSYDYYSAQILQAQEILDAAGFVDVDGDGFREAPDGSGFSVNIEVAQSSDISTGAGYIARDTFQQIGIEAETTPTNFYEYLNRLDFHRDFDMVFMGRAFQNMDVDWLAYEFWSEYADEPYWNFANFRNSTYDSWRNQLLDSLDYDDVYEAAIEMQRILLYECPFVICYENIQYTGTRKGFENVVIHSSQGATCIDTYLGLRTPSPEYNTVTSAVVSANVLNPFIERRWYENQLSSAISFNPMTLVYESLMRENASGNFVPYLAESVHYENMGDHVEIVITLPSNAVWHDLAPVTSEDIVFTYEYMQAHSIPHYDGVYLVSGIEKIDASHVRISVTPGSYWNLRSVLEVPILPEHIWSTVTDPYAFDNTNPIGTGPFIVDSYATHNVFGSPTAEYTEWQMVTGNTPEIANFHTYEEGEYLIGVNFYEGELPVGYNILVSYEGTTSCQESALTESDIINWYDIPQSADEIEKLHYIWLPSDTDVHIEVSWNTTGDLDIYLWAPSDIRTDVITDIRLQRWHDYHNSEIPLRTYAPKVEVSPRIQGDDTVDTAVSYTGPYDTAFANLTWCYSVDNETWTEWRILQTFFWKPSDYKEVLQIDANIYGEGYYMVRLEAVDSVGHVAVSYSWGYMDWTDPTAVAGPDHIIQQWSYFTFNGLDSSDNSAIRDYQWSFYDDGQVTLWGASPTYQFSNIGTFDVTLTVTDFGGRESTDNLVLTVVYDYDPPSISVSGTTNSTTVSTDASYHIESADETGINRTDIYLDGELVLSTEAAVVDYVLDPTMVSDGQHTIEIKVYDVFGQEKATVYVVFTDTTPPEISSDLPSVLTEPIDCTVVAQDESGIDRVEFWLDGMRMITDYTEPYVFYVNTHDLADGEHNLTVVAFDGAGNLEFEVRIFLVDKTPPQLTSIDTSFANGIPGWNLTIKANATDFSGVSTMHAVLCDSTGSSYTITMHEVAPWHFEGEWTTLGIPPNLFFIDIVAVDTYGNTRIYGNATWVRLCDYLLIESQRAMLSLSDVYGNTINSTIVDYIDEYGNQMAYYIQSLQDVEILMLSPDSGSYTMEVTYLLGSFYSLMISATSEGVIVSQKTYADIPLAPDEMHSFLIKYSPPGLTSIALPELFVVVSTDNLFAIPREYLTCYVDWFNIDPGTAVDIDISLEYSGSLEFASCTYPVSLSDNKLTVHIDSTSGFSYSNLEIEFFVSLLNTNGTSLWINCTLQYSDEWSLIRDESYDCQMITVVMKRPSNSIQSSLWWKNEFSNILAGRSGTYNFSRIQKLVNMISFSSEHFEEITTLEQALSTLTLNDIKGPEGLADRELYTLWLNLANNALSADTEVDLGKLSRAGTVGEAIIECEFLLFNDSASNKDFLRAMRICLSINIFGS